nr:MAG TPA: hypothetical protein [Podoviridae sp. ctgx11]
MEKIKTYKGFDEKLQCRGFRYEVGKEYENSGDVECCARGFHACENPLEVFAYYNPAQNRFCEVEQSGVLERDNEGSKVASSKISIKCEIGLRGLIEAGVKFILEKIDFKNAKKSNTGNYSAATNTGNYSAATNTGFYSAATNTGYSSAAKVEGNDSIAIVTGKSSAAAGEVGCWLVLTERDTEYKIKDVQAVRVDGEAIKANVFYKLVDGKILETEL